ncbi:MAG: cobalamin-dependent protein, partial [Candidatus Thermoplasmatota archaeon]
MRILGASIGNCVHVGGIVNFLKLAEKHGYETEFLGPATPVQRVVDEFGRRQPDILALSYRLTPETGRSVLLEVAAAKEAGKFGTARLVFGGTPEVARIASELGIFDWVVTGAEYVQDLEARLTGEIASKPPEAYPDAVLGRIAWARPTPILRHHFGRPDLQETIEGCRKIAESRVLDVISIAPDQNAQEFFFRPEQMRDELTGAGGVPVRRPEDLQALYEASRCGNYPLLRCYSGTNELVKWARMLKDTIHVAWGAVPLFWYSQLDGRSTRPLEVSIKENLEAVAWYAANGIPVEMNESHQWSLRNAHDAVAVTSAFLAAYNAKQQGATTYVQQLMFNNPPGTSPAMDLAKMLAKLELLDSLRARDFGVVKEVRTGLTSLPLDPDMAKGHLGSSIHTMVAMKPDILHVVGYSEADFAATPEVV